MRKTLFLAGRNNNSPTEGEMINTKSERIDIVLLMILSSILFLGSIMIFSASYPYASLHYGDGFYYVKRQIVF